jgi:hypothetical protein
MLAGPHDGRIINITEFSTGLLEASGTGVGDIVTSDTKVSLRAAQTGKTDVKTHS